jgi:MFS family permease
LADEKPYTLQFWLLCVSGLLFFASFNMLIPELPAYLTSLGGAQYKGLIISLFTLTAMLSRPFSGKLADTVGRVPVIIAGSIVCFICSLIYPLVTSVAAFLLLRLAHGFSTGFAPTGTAAYLSDVIPLTRRGEAMGILGTAGAVGMAGGPAIGGLLANQFGLNALFYCSSAFGLMSVLILLRLKETLNQTQPFRLAVLKVNKSDLFEPRVIVPCLVMVLLAFSYGTVYTIIPDFGEHVGIRNKGLLFSYMTLASLLMRFIGGKASDRWGRAVVLRISAVVTTTAMFVIGSSDSALQLTIGMCLYGLAYGATSPTLIAWASDLSDTRFRGRGLASMYIAMEFGIGFGALMSGWLFADDATQFFMIFSTCAMLAVSAFFYLLVVRYKSLPKA